MTVRPHWPGHLVELPTGPLHVREAGEPGGGREPAVMVHGLGGAATNWTDLMGLLEDRLHCIAPDLPGFGWSPPPPDGDYSVRAHARALTALLESVGDGRPVHLLGNSLGGTVALVVLTMVTERATQRLSGASVVREDVRQAVIRAVLAAVNRRVEPLIPGAGDAPA